MLAGIADPLRVIDSIEFTSRKIKRHNLNTPTDNFSKIKLMFFHRIYAPFLNFDSKKGTHFFVDALDGVLLVLIALGHGSCLASFAPALSAATPDSVLPIVLAD